MKITRAKGGTLEKQVPLSRIVIPDIWHEANLLVPEDRDRVLECWHLAHDLLRTLQELEAKEKP